jgi:hypothetical protein
MSDFKVEFRLKQHTPLIHFQSEQSGATLRATELKPKLDRFLIKYVFKDSKKQYEKFLIETGKDALDYKVEIVVQKSQTIDIKNKSYFGNMGKKPHDNEFRKAVISKQVFISFFSYNSTLITYIKEYFAAFLALENFGTRQSKGFGSFYLSKDDSHYIDIFEALHKTGQHYIYAQYEGELSDKVFSHVEVIYPLIKTGINYPDLSTKDHPRGFTDRNGNIKQVPDHSAGRGVNASYYRSFLFQYMHEKHGVGNEKRFIKEHFFPQHSIDDDGNEKRYVRALLGVADGVTFRDLRNGKISYENQKIKRFKSPLTFKIVDDFLIIIAQENKAILNKEFTFEDNYNNEEHIRTPKEFDIYDFLNAFSDYFNALTITQSKNMFDKKILNAKKASFQKVAS